MKKSKKFLSVLCAVCMILAFAVPAFAAEIEEEFLPPPTLLTYQDVHRDALNPVQAALLSNDTIACYIPYNDGSGTSGEIVESFEAESSTLGFILYSYGGGTKYHAALWRDNGPGKPPSRVALYEDYSFGSGFTQPGLVVGKEYYIVVSSTTVTPPGVNGGYEIFWY